jgi:hypothetical protein
VSSSNAESPPASEVVPWLVEPHGGSSGRRGRSTSPPARATVARRVAPRVPTVRIRQTYRVSRSRKPRTSGSFAKWAGQDSNLPPTDYESPVPTPRRSPGRARGAFGQWPIASEAPAAVWDSGILADLHTTHGRLRSPSDGESSNRGCRAQASSLISHRARRADNAARRRILHSLQGSAGRGQVSRASVAAEDAVPNRELAWLLPARCARRESEGDSDQVHAAPALSIRVAG